MVVKVSAYRLEDHYVPVVRSDGSRGVVPKNAEDERESEDRRRRSAGNCTRAGHHHHGCHSPNQSATEFDADPEALYL